jgi:electron transfer flavoprotein alpha subunit
MAVLVIADHDGSTVRDTTHKTVTAALGLSSDVDVLVLGQGAQAAADSAAKIAGVRKVLLADSAPPVPPLPICKVEPAVMVVPPA